ncbi:3-hydroxyisobutyrate dehydrogenase, mitochondrial-like [Prionailurus bengalensis]|uniref:3-hydroxyisobutyrate dehydrogenase, mitochondrial-like n=1 Tax=Prionailurus bengalensis TaxID=37029 RepID=UPI001CA8707F|nr:3-hydroxyisobutyrate dehydrogenase, mitochondrial-like [Prionailurus bengalensis]
MLPMSVNAIEDYSGANETLKKVKKGSLSIDCGTIDATVSRELAKEVEKMGAVFMDVPVPGSVGAAVSGNLLFLVGEVKDEFAATKSCCCAWTPIWSTVELLGLGRLQRSATT